MADISNKQSLENTLNWKEQVDNNIALPDGRSIPMILVVNKYDLIEELESNQ